MRKNVSKPIHSVFQWFFTIFSVLLLVFLITLLPLIIYCRNIFTDLALEKSRQQLTSGVVQIENTVTSILGISETLATDSRFMLLRYAYPDYTTVDVTVRNQARNIFCGLTLPLSLVSDSALQFDQNVVITPRTVFFEDQTLYYPDFFCVDNLTHEEWFQILKENRTGFLSMHHITTNLKEYDALIYATKWTNSSYIYACLDIEHVKSALIAKDELHGCSITLTNTDGVILYSDVPENAEKYHSITQSTAKGDLSITIHILDSVISSKMKPLYIFLAAYFSIFLLVLLGTILISTRISAEPILKIIRVLERSGNLSNSNTLPNSFPDASSIRYGFHYIHDSILHVEESIVQYRDTIHTQHKILEERYFEKAIEGQLLTEKERELFHSYFPDFPEKYRLILFQLQVQDIDTNDDVVYYPDALYLMFSFIQNIIPESYTQQMNDTELLIVMDEADYEKHCEILNFVVSNINAEESAYCTRCIAGNTYHHLESLPTAYRQLQDLSGFSFQDSQIRVCTVSDCLYPQQNPSRMATLHTLYTAVTYGNADMAVQKLSDYAAELSSGNRSLYEMVHSVLLCIKLEYPQSLMDISIPSYCIGEALYLSLIAVTKTFCEVIHAESIGQIDPFVEKLVHYIDAHYTEYELCLSTLEAEFKCSSSTIRKAFKSNMGITVADYIEKKRMNHARELLLTREKTISEIAVECGFSNSNSFYKAYRRIFGHAPTDEGSSGNS